MRKHVLPVLLAGSLLTGCAGMPETEPLPDESSAEKVIAIADLTPGEDYYGFMNADELMHMTLREDQNSTGTLSSIGEHTDDCVKELIREIAAGSGYAKGTNKQLIRDLYHLAADTNAGKLDTDAADTAFFDGWLDKINKTESMEQLYALWGEMAAEFGFNGVPVPLSVGTDLYHAEQTILCAGVYPRTPGLKDLCEEPFATMDERGDLQGKLTLSGVSRDDARKRATQIVLAELEFAAVVDFDVIEDGKPDQTFHRRQKDALQKELRNITPEQIMQMNGLSFRMPDSISVAIPEQLRVLDSFLDDTHVPMWKDYTICSLIEQFSDMLPKKYRGDKPDSPVKDEDFAVSIVNQYLAVEVGEEYAAEYCTEKMVTDVTGISKEIIEKYKELIEKNDWMSDRGKQALRQKLSNMSLFIGADAPREPDPKHADQIGDSLLSTCCAVNRFMRADELEKLGKPTDRNGFRSMTPQTVNACYVPEINAFNVTAAIMQAPIYDPSASFEANLGGIGSIIGHEISHGFDADGMNYDAEGNFRPDWIPQEDRDAFDQLTKKVEDYYSNFTVLDSHRVNGQKTVCENLADISGLQCVLEIAGTRDRQKTVLEHYAKVWEELIIDTAAKSQVDTDVHSPASVRINAVVACFDPFYEIYGIKETDALYVAPEERLRRW